jgi:hypothetical protein
LPTNSVRVDFGVYSSRSFSSPCTSASSTSATQH